MKEVIKKIIYLGDLTFVITKSGKRLIIDKKQDIRGVKVNLGKPSVVVYDELNHIEAYHYECPICKKTNKNYWDLTLCDLCKTFYFKCCPTRTTTKDISIDSKNYNMKINICPTCQHEEDRRDVLKKMG